MIAPFTGQQGGAKGAILHVHRSQAIPGAAQEEERLGEGGGEPREEGTDWLAAVVEAVISFQNE